VSSCTENSLVMILHKSRIEGVPTLHVQRHQPLENTLDRVLDKHRIGHDRESAAVEHDVVVGTEDDDIAGNIWTEMWMAERPEMVSFGVAAGVGQDHRVTTDLTDKLISLLDLDGKERVAQPHCSQDLSGAGHC
jgi:hypothetical protein